MERRCKRVPFYRERKKRLLNRSINKSNHPTLLCPVRTPVLFLSGQMTENHPAFPGKRVTFCTSRKGSLTVEAALVLPIFLFAVLTLLNLMEVCRIQGIVNVSLQNSAETLGTYGYVLPGEENGAELVLGSGVCILYAQNQLPGEIGTRGTVSLLGSRYEDHTVKLQAEYKMKVGYLFFIPEVKVICRGRVRAWTGDTEEERAAVDYEEMVFVTEYGEVYHTSSSCRHLSVSISAAALSKVSAMRNENGEKYYACEKCVGSGTVNELVYVTGTGNRYHNSLECSGLKRSVRLVKLSEVSGYPLCSTCRAMAAEGEGT